jgi:hypothetical protein
MAVRVRIIETYHSLISHCNSSKYSLRTLTVLPWGAARATVAKATMAMTELLSIILKSCFCMSKGILIVGLLEDLKVNVCVSRGMICM